MSITQAALATIHRPASVLMQYDAACKAVAAAKSVDEVKDIRDKSEAMRAYAKQAKNKQLEVDASEIRFRAERRIGELMEMQGSGDGFGKTWTKDRVGFGPELSSLSRRYRHRQASCRPRSQVRRYPGRTIRRNSFRPS